MPKAFQTYAVIENPCPEMMKFLHDATNLVMTDHITKELLPAIKLSEEWRLVVDADKQKYILYGPPEVKR